MEKKTILLTTNHPAPYIDKWIDEIKLKYKVIVIYNHMRSEKKSWTGFAGHKGYCFETLRYAELKKIIKQCDLLIIGGWTNKECMTTIILGRVFKKKIALFTDYPFHQNKYAVAFKRLFLYRIINFVYGATYSTCDYIEEKYKLKSDKVLFFPYAVDFRIEGTESGIQNSDGTQVNVLIANNFIKRKGYSILFGAFKILDHTHTKDFVFHIAGHGEEFDKYRKIASELDLDIRFYGWVENEEYRNLQRISQVYIHPSLEEPFGIPPLDAMARGKVVIVSDGVKSTNTIINKGINGFIYSSTNSSELASILLKLRNYDFEQIGIQAAKDVRKYYGIENINKTIARCMI